MIEDSELIVRSIRRDDRAFAALFDRHAPVVFRYALSLSGAPADAQDLTQQTFVTAWRRLADIRLVGRSVLPWLMVVCRNHSQNLRRSKAIHDTSPLPPTAQSPVMDDVEAREELAAVLRAVAGLSELDRAILELCVFEGRTYKEAGEFLGTSPASLAKRMERTRRLLKSVRSDYLGEEA